MTRTGTGMDDGGLRGWHEGEECLIAGTGMEMGVIKKMEKLRAHHHP